MSDVAVVHGEPAPGAEGYRKPARWADPAKKLFPYQVGFTAPPHDFDAAPTDFLRIAPQSVGAHGRMLHAPAYAHELAQRVDNFHLLEEVVHCMANNGADVVGQVGTNWVRVSETYETPFHMAGMCLVEGLRELNVEKIALNSVYYWPDWRDGIARFLKQAGFDLLYYGNFVDLGLYDTQDRVNEQVWIFPGEMAERSMLRVAELAPDAEAVVVNGMPNFRGADGLPRRVVSLAVSLANDLEAAIGKPIVASDLALYWRIFKTLGVGPIGDRGRLLSTLA
jgi:maleate cis-trans isomerase